MDTIDRDMMQRDAVLADVYCSPAVAADGWVFFGTESGLLYALEPDGTLGWSYASGNGINWTSPAIGDDGTLYFGNNDGTLTALQTDTTGLAGSSWPRFHGDNQSTGRVSP